MAKELEFIPALKEGEILLIHRSLGDKTVVMVVTITGDAFDHLSKDEICLTASMDTWGVTPHADATIGRQRESIDRLLRHVQSHCADPGACEFRDLTPTVDVVKEKLLKFDWDDYGLDVVKETVRDPRSQQWADNLAAAIAQALSGNPLV